MEMDDYFPNYDPKEQVDAITSMLEVLHQWRAKINREAADTIDDDTGQGDSVTLMRTVYIEAAYCHAAVGAVAPMLEGMYLHEFTNLRKFFNNGKPLSNHLRWQLSPDDFWNPRNKYKQSVKGIAKETTGIQFGSVELLTALGLIDRLPANFNDLTSALFTYRNRALHSGYEWSKESVIKFEKLVQQNGWDKKWFVWARVDYKPWVAYMTDGFIGECLNAIVASMSVFDEIREEWSGERSLGETFRKLLGKRRIPPELG